MKYLAAFIPLLLGFISPTFAQTSLQTVQIKTMISCDHCLRCGSCAPRLQKAIRANKGIKSVHIDADEDIITVRYRTDKTDLMKIRKAISQAGFDADDMVADPRAYDALDACCKRPDVSNGE